MSRDPVRLAMGGPAGARLARAMRASRKTDAHYDVATGLARFTASVGAAGAVSIVASTASANSATVATTSAAKAVAGAGKAALGLKSTMSSILLVGAMGSGALVATSEVLRSSDSRTREESAAAPRWPATPPSPSPSLVPRALAPPPGALPVEEPSGVPPPEASAPSPPTSPSLEGGVSSRAPAASSPGAASASAMVPGAAGQVIPGASGDPSSSRSAASIKPEMEHLARIRRTYDPVRALALAEEGHARFPRGLFWQERESVAIGSLARLGRTSEARARARGFIARHPKSFYVEELRRLLGD